MLFLLVIYVLCAVNGENENNLPTTLVGPCHRRPNGFARDLENCANYIYCENGHARRDRCRDDLLFDAENEVCGWREDVTCFQCPRNEVYALLPVPKTCHQFYQCWMGRASIHSCPGSLIFDPKIRRCNFVMGSGCDGDDQEEEGCPAVDGPVPTYLAHASSCSQYFVCSNGTPLPRTCAQGLHFNRILRICDTPTNANCQLEDGVCLFISPIPSATSEYQFLFILLFRVPAMKVVLMKTRTKVANQVSHVPILVTDSDRTETTATHTLRAQTVKQR